MRLHEARRDYYRRLAREHGYKSRAAFKLIEANSKYALIARGDRVIDFGAAPGGWLQVASQLVGENGLVVGVDTIPVNLSLANVRTLVYDVLAPGAEEKIREVLGTRADVVLSDIAPQVSGAWDLDHYRQVELTLRVTEIAKELLRPGGNAVLKLFQGERFTEVQELWEKSFERVRITKPKASRQESSELYFVCLGYLG